MSLAPKPASEDAETSDADPARLPAPLTAPVPLRARLTRLFGSWAGFTGLYALTGGMCPCCGRAACPNGLLGAGIVGGILALGLRAWRHFRK